jgi:hypothetical protein
MRDHYYALSKNDGWAAMSPTCKDDPNPPIVIFESPEVAERYRHEIAGDDWEVLAIDSEEVEYHADDSDNRVLLCTKIGDHRIDKFELTVEDLERRDIECN